MASARSSSLEENPLVEAVRLVLPSYAVVLLIVSLTMAHEGVVATATPSTWDCTTLVNQSVGNASDASALRWIRLNCSGTTPVGNVGPMVFNVIVADLASPELFFTPMVSNATHQLAPLNAIAHQDPRVVVGINGGYFYRTDAPTFFDDVCWGKNLSDTEAPVDPAYPNHGVGDTLVVVDGVRVGSNCACVGYNRPALLVLNATSSYMTVQTTAAPPPAGTLSAIAAGPNLVSNNGTASYVDIPSDDENVNILEWSSNTAVGIRRGNDGSTTRELLLVTADGYDGCPWLDKTCGLDSYHFAYFMKDYMGSTTALEMDQGGSTTMFVKGEGRDGIVSCTSKGCTGGPRPLFSGLMVGVL